MFLLLCVALIFIPLYWYYRYLNNCCYEVSPYIIHLNHLYSNLLDFRKNSNVRHWTQCWGHAGVKGLSRVSIEEVLNRAGLFWVLRETGWGGKNDKWSSKSDLPKFLVTSSGLFSLFGKHAMLTGTDLCGSEPPFDLFKITKNQIKSMSSYLEFCTIELK